MENFVLADRDYNENREVPISDKNKAFIRKAPGPYGFWVVTFERGKPPAHLCGHYTSWSVAEKAVKDYIETQK